MRKDIQFKSKGLRCSGWLFVPDDLEEDERAPAVVMGHGFGGVKDMRLAPFAEKFESAGFVTLVFDYRYFGDSEGEPRCQLFPLDQVEDFRNAITWLSDRREVDSERIGIWGSSFSGGVVLHVATFDKRVKAIVAQVPAAVSLEDRRAANPEGWNRLHERLLQDRIERYWTGLVNYVKIVAPEGEPCVLQGQENYEGYMTLVSPGSTWQNQVTIESLEKINEFDPVNLIHLISPRALLLIPAEMDSLIPVDAVRASYEKAKEPKKIIILPIGHFDIYHEPWRSKAADAMIKWYRQHL